MARRRRQAIERFWAFVEVCGPDDCWLWLGACNGHGYGYFKLNGVAVRAHRLSLTLFAGPAEDESLYALHSCDVRRCCNPAHLRWGNQSENVKDEYARFRRAPRRIELAGVQAELV